MHAQEQTRFANEDGLALLQQTLCKCMWQSALPSSQPEAGPVLGLACPFTSLWQQGEEHDLLVPPQPVGRTR